MKNFVRNWILFILFFSSLSSKAQFRSIVNEVKSAINKIGKMTSSTSPTSSSHKSIVHSRFDFVPGDSILLVDDFSHDLFGNMPKGWKSNKSGKIVTLDGFTGQWLAMDDATTYKTVKPINIPEKATIEFDLVAAAEKITDLEGELSFGITKDNSARSYVYQNQSIFYTALWYVTGENYEIKSNTTGIDEKGQFDFSSYINQKMHVFINIDHQNVQIYLDKIKLADTKLLDTENKFKYFFVSTQAASINDAKVMIGNFRLATFKNQK